jgi:hypothetical protein
MQRLLRANKRSILFVTATLIAALAMASVLLACSGQLSKASEAGSGYGSDVAGTDGDAGVAAPGSENGSDGSDATGDIMGDMSGVIYISDAAKADVVNAADVAKQRPSKNGSSKQAAAYYPVNDNGQTYGTWGNVDEEKELAGGYPDLIAVRADNGNFGYAYRADYEVAFQTDIPIRSAAAEARYEKDTTDAADAICEYYRRVTGVDADQQVVYALFREIEETTNRHGCYWDDLGDQLQNKIAGLFPEGQRSLATAQEAYEHALRSNDFILTVYALDGKTEIGDVYVQYP